jgi:hypothetical protein
MTSRTASNTASVIVAEVGAARRAAEPAITTGYACAVR